MTTISLLNGKRCNTHIPLDELHVLYKSVIRKQANIIIQVFWGDKEVGIDLRRLDSEATFTPQVIFTEVVA